MIEMAIKFKKDDVKEAMDYLEGGGLGEVFGFTYGAYETGHPEVKCDVTTALALCMLAHEAVQARRDAKETRQ